MQSISLLYFCISYWHALCAPVAAPILSASSLFHAYLHNCFTAGGAMRVGWHIPPFSFIYHVYAWIILLSMQYTPYLSFYPLHVHAVSFYPLRMHIVSFYPLHTHKVSFYPFLVRRASFYPVMYTSCLSIQPRALAVFLSTHTCTGCLSIQSWCRDCLSIHT